MPAGYQILSASPILDRPTLPTSERNRPVFSLIESIAVRIEIHCGSVRIRLGLLSTAIGAFTLASHNGPGRARAGTVRA